MCVRNGFVVVYVDFSIKLFAYILMPPLPPSQEEVDSAERLPRLSPPLLSLSAIRLLGALVVVGSIGTWGLWNPLFRDADGFLMGSFTIVIAVGVAALLVGLAPRHWKTAAMWAALALVGQAMVLQLVDAGTSLHYQHYEVGILAADYPWQMGFVTLQTVLVLAALRTRWRTMWRWLTNTFSPLQLLGIGTLFVLSSATLSSEVAFYGLELVFATFMQAVSLGTVVVAIWSLPGEALAGVSTRFARFLRSGNEVRPGLRLDHFAVAVALWVVLVSVVLNVLSYERHPHVPDEVVYLRHAQYLAKGMLSMEAPAVPEAFEHYLLDVSERGWYVVSPHGWPLVLALGWLIGAPWLINPLLAGLNVLLAYLLLRALYDLHTARLSILLLGVSPWYLFLGMSFMNHMSTLAFALLATLSVVQARRTEAVWWTWAGGLALGMLALLRPLEAVIVAGLLGLWMLGVGGARLRPSQMAGLVLGSMIVAFTLLLYNEALTGDPLLFPITAYTDVHFHPNANALGFGSDRGTGWALDPYPGHGLRDVVVNANLNLTTLNTDLFGWSSGSLLLIVVALFSGRLRRSDRLMLATMGTTFVALSCYYFSGGPDFGPRYWFLMVVPCVALTARGINVLAERVNAGAGGNAAAGWRVGAGVMLLCVMALFTFVPWRAIDKYHHFRGMRPDVRDIAAEYSFGKSLVLIRGKEHPDFSSASVYNPVDLDDAVPVYAWDRGPEVREALREAFPDRPVWVIQGPTLSGDGYRIISGPDAPAEANGAEP